MRVGQSDAFERERNVHTLSKSLFEETMIVREQHAECKSVVGLIRKPLMRSKVDLIVRKDAHMYADNRGLCCQECCIVPYRIAWYERL